jgi:DNA-binding transcriptional LysR family regulator
MVVRRQKDLRIASIETFVRLARTRNQPDVAAEMGCDQATVSRNITALEKWMRRVLVFAGSPVRLTEDGERFLPEAIKVLALLDEARGVPAPLPKPGKSSGKDIMVPPPRPGPRRR